MGTEILGSERREKRTGAKGNVPKKGVLCPFWVEPAPKGMDGGVVGWESGGGGAEGGSETGSGSLREWVVRVGQG